MVDLPLPCFELVEGIHVELNFLNLPHVALMVSSFDSPSFYGLFVSYHGLLSTHQQTTHQLQYHSDNRNESCILPKNGDA